MASKTSLLCTPFPYGVAILLGDGTGHFSAPIIDFAVDNEPHSIAVGDFNGDGKQDLAIPNYFSGDVSILLRICAASQLTPAGTTCTQFSSGVAQPLGYSGIKHRPGVDSPGQPY